MNTTDTILVSYNFDMKTGNGVLIVGRKTRGEVADIINAFEGEEARELYTKLITKKTSGGD